MEIQYYFFQIHFKESTVFIIRSVFAAMYVESLTYKWGGTFVSRFPMWLTYIIMLTLFSG